MITVTQPLLPPLQEFFPYLEDIWNRKWITNNGFYHTELEKALCEYLKVPYISLFTNGTIPLMIALQKLRITGEVITTPFSFVATTHAIWWNGLTPVFVDVEEETGNLDPTKIEDAITKQTTAIMPVHVYGNPCNTEKIQSIADKYGLKVIYDAAHAFGVEKNGISILNAGDMSTLSFHATKTYNTIEGGAIVCQNKETKKQIDYMKNFGFEGESEVSIPGINGKMDEIRSAYGILNLNYIDEAIGKRKIVVEQYRKELRNIPGIRYMQDLDEVKYNYSYFPIFVNKVKLGTGRDILYEKLKDYGIFSRRYFYPLISSFSPYRNLVSASENNLPIATKLASEVICLPTHHGLEEKEVDMIIDIILKEKK
jgi:dTDP-4-amino-4,6-dideoxygalactose transaminase